MASNVSLDRDCTIENLKDFGSDHIVSTVDRTFEELAVRSLSFSGC